jgi:hypothetical protein
VPAQSLALDPGQARREFIKYLLSIISLCGAQGLCGAQEPCKGINQATVRSHFACVKHFWGLYYGGQPEEEKALRDSVAMAVRNRDAEILEYLLSRECPWQMRDIDYASAKRRPVLLPW